MCVRTEGSRHTHPGIGHVRTACLRDVPQATSSSAKAIALILHYHPLSAAGDLVFREGDSADEVRDRSGAVTVSGDGGRFYVIMRGSAEILVQVSRACSLLFHAMLCYSTLRYAMLLHAMRCGAMRRDAMRAQGADDPPDEPARVATIGESKVFIA